MIFFCNDLVQPEVLSSPQSYPAALLNSGQAPRSPAARRLRVSFTSAVTGCGQRGGAIGSSSCSQLQPAAALPLPTLSARGQDWPPAFPESQLAAGAAAAAVPLEGSSSPGRVAPVGGDMGGASAGTLLLPPLTLPGHGGFAVVGSEGAPMPAGGGLVAAGGGLATRRAGAPPPAALAAPLVAADTAAPSRPSSKRLPGSVAAPARAATAAAGDPMVHRHPLRPVAALPRPPHVEDEHGGPLQRGIDVGSGGGRVNPSRWRSAPGRKRGELEVCQAEPPRLGTADPGGAGIAGGAPPMAPKLRLYSQIVKDYSEETCSRATSAMTVPQRLLAPPSLNISGSEKTLRLGEGDGRLRLFPEVYANICKDEVLGASDRLDEALRCWTERRRECNTAERRHDRQQAVEWRRVAKKRALRTAEREKQKSLEEEARRQEAETRAHDSRWKRAFERLKGRSASIEDCSKRAGVGLLAELEQVVPEETNIELEAPKPRPKRAQCAAAINTHLELLRKLQKLRVRAVRAVRSHDARRQRFEMLPADERRLYEDAFARCGDPQTCALDALGLRECIYEVGMFGDDTTEHLAVFETCVEALRSAQRARLSMVKQEGTQANWSQGVDLPTFAMVVVPAVKKRLEAMRGPRLEEEFALADTAGHGFVSIEQCALIVHNVLEIDVDSTSASSAVSELLGRERLASGTLDYQEVQRVATHLSVLNQRAICQKERQTQAQHQIDNATFFASRPDITLLSQLFKHHVGQPKDGVLPGTTLPEAKCAKLLQDFGIEGASDSPHMDGTSVDFLRLLALVELLRVEAEDRSFEHLRRPFLEFTEDLMRIAVEAVLPFLETVSLTPKIGAEQEAFIHALRNVYVSSMSEDNTFGFDEIKRTLQRSKEFLARLKRETEFKTLRENGFHDSELDHLHYAFQQLDVDNSGTLEIDEAWHAVSLLSSDVNRSAFNAVYKTVDEDGNGGLDFLEFVVLLRLIRNREGVFAENREIRKLEDLTSAESIHVLKYFGVTPNTEDHMDRGLTRKVCECFDIPPKDSLKACLGITYFQDLCVAASENNVQNASSAWLGPSARANPRSSAFA